MMKKNILVTLLSVLGWCAVVPAHAVVVTFDQPQLVTVNNTTDVATYSEAGYAFAGMSASFLPLDGIGSGGSGGLYVMADYPLMITAKNQQLFNFIAADFGLFDPSSSGFLTIAATTATGTLQRMFMLGALSPRSFPGLTGVSSVMLSATTDFVLDNVRLEQGSTVAEPGTLLLSLLALCGLGWSRRCRVTLTPSTS